MRTPSSIAAASSSLAPSGTAYSSIARSAWRSSTRSGGSSAAARRANATVSLPDAVKMSVRASVAATWARSRGSSSASHASRRWAAAAGPDVSVSASPSWSRTRARRSRRRRLLERPREVRRRALPGTPGLRRLGRLVEDVHYPFLGPARAAQQLCGDLLCGCVGLQQQTGRLGMAKLPLAGGNVVVDRVPDERMHEAEGWLLSQDVRPRQRGRHSGGFVLLEHRESRDEGKLRPVAQNRDGLGHGGRLVRQAMQPAEHGTRDRPRAHLLDGAHLRCAGRHTVRSQRAEQLAQQQRVAARGREAGTGERRLRCGAEPRANQLGHACLAERAAGAAATRPGRRRAHRSAPGPCPARPYVGRPPAPRSRRRGGAQGRPGTGVTADRTTAGRPPPAAAAARRRC